MWKPIRWIIGRGVLAYEKFFAPKPPERTHAAQAAINRQTTRLTLYEYKACPFCMKVRLHMRKLGLNINRRDAKRNHNARDELMQLGGKLQVPCLYIGKTDGADEWLYESDAIIAWLDREIRL
jgi:glutaredoxin